MKDLKTKVKNIIALISFKFEYAENMLAAIEVKEKEINTNIIINIIDHEGIRYSLQHVIGECVLIYGDIYQIMAIKKEIDTW